MFPLFYMLDYQNPMISQESKCWMAMRLISSFVCYNSVLYFGFHCLYFSYGWDIDYLPYTDLRSRRHLAPDHFSPRLLLQFPMLSLQGMADIYWAVITWPLRFHFFCVISAAWVLFVANAWACCGFLFGSIATLEGVVEGMYSSYVLSYIHIRSSM